MSRRLGGRGAAAGSSPACGWVGSLSLAAGVARLVRPSVYPSVRLFVCVCLSVCLPRSGPPRQDSHALEGAGRAPLALPPARVPVLGLLRPRVVLATAHMQRRCSCILGSSGIAQRLRDQACSPSGSGGDLLARRRRWEAEREGRGGAGARLPTRLRRRASPRHLPAAACAAATWRACAPPRRSARPPRKPRVRA